MALHRSKVRVNTTGGVGTATGSNYSRDFITGIVLGVYYKADGAAPPTTDLAVIEYNDETPQTILSKQNVNTSQWFYPRLALCNSADGSSLSGPVDFITTDNQILVTIAQANPNQTYDVIILWDDMQ